VIEHINLNNGSRQCFREADYPKRVVTRFVKALSGCRNGFDDGYCVSAGYLSLDRVEYLFGLYTPDRNLFERSIGLELSHRGEPVLAAALVHAPDQFLSARERLYGAWLHGMPHRPPMLEAYPPAEHFPALLSVEFANAAHEIDDSLYRTPLDDLPCIAFAIIRLLQEI
jgi:hypothetical protein